MATKQTTKIPILPQNKFDPTGTVTEVNRAKRNFKRRFDRIYKGAVELLNAVPSRLAVNRKYTYELTEYTLSSVLNGLDILVESELMEVIGRDLWFYEEYMEKAYRRGAIQSYLNLSAQSAAYRGDLPNTQSYLLSERYRSRLAIVRSRQFELMKGIVGETKSDLSRVLTEGMARGLNPRDIARNIRHEVNIEQGRANRIAQTEITGALRRARWDEADAAEQAYNVRIMMLHMSALKPTTREGHALRHGRLYSVDDVREWYSQGATSINCFCVQIEVTVDESGNPTSPAMQRRMKVMHDQSVDLIDEIRESKK